MAQQNSTQKIAAHINQLASFCGRRDIPNLTPQALQEAYGFAQVDVMVLFGGSILAGGDVLAAAMQQGLAKKYIIVGGAGHTTEALRIKMQGEIPAIQTKNLPEAQIFDAYLQHRYGLRADYLECDSTNCGNNITFLLQLLEREHIPCHSILLTQDATMQHRMGATLQKYRPDLTIVHYAAYQVAVQAVGDALVYDQTVWGMWEIARYIELLMGEIPRLTDDANGYGPCGAGYIAHVDIPQTVHDAFDALKNQHQFATRAANPAFADKAKSN